MAERLTPFQRQLVDQKGKIDYLDVLKEFSARLVKINAYPPIIPQAGKALYDILTELEEVQNVGRASKQNKTPTSDS